MKRFFRDGIQNLSDSVEQREEDWQELKRGFEEAIARERDPKRLEYLYQQSYPIFNGLSPAQVDKRFPELRRARERLTQRT